jgi:hypothetical protein
MQITDSNHWLGVSPFRTSVVPPFTPPIESCLEKLEKLFGHLLVLGLQVIVTQVNLCSQPTLKVSSRLYDVAHRDRLSPFLDEPHA